MGYGKAEKTNFQVPWGGLPHQKYISQHGEDQPDKDPPRISVTLVKAHAMQKNKHHKRHDGQALGNAEEDGTSFFLSKKNKEDCHRLKERHKFWPNALQLKEIKKNGTK